MPWQGANLWEKGAGSSRNLLSVQKWIQITLGQLVTAVEPLFPWKIHRPHRDTGSSCQHCLTQGEKGRGAATTTVHMGKQKEMTQGIRLWEKAGSSAEFRGWRETPLRATAETVVENIVWKPWQAIPPALLSSCLLAT